jgi:hypothetical protein
MNYVLAGYQKIKAKLDSIEYLYSIEDTRTMLLENDLWTYYFGRAKNRTMINDDPVLYKSIMYHSLILETTMKQQNSFKWSYGFTNRIKFIVEHGGVIDNLKCKCGKTYNWTSFCRKCPDPKKTWTGRSHSEDTKLKQRISTLKYIHESAGQVSPRYNKSSIVILEAKAAELGITDLMHAENGGEYQVAGYFLDGYSPSKNIAIEYDEKHHYKNGKLRKKDYDRQNQIERVLGCTFIRIKQ